MGNPIRPHAIVFPYPYQGHITPAINLSIKLASYGFTITFVQLEFVHHSMSKSCTSFSDADMFAGARDSGLDIRYATISDGYPVEYDRDLNYNEYWDSMFRDFPPRVEQFVNQIIEDEANKSCSFFLVADTFYSWPSVIAEKCKMVNVSLWTEPAIVFALCYHLDILKENGHFPGNSENNQINYIPGVKSIATRDLMTYIQDPDMLPMVTQNVIRGFDQVKKADFIICNTVQELESETLSELNRIHPTYAVGPINFYAEQHLTSTIAKSLRPEFDCSQWLSNKPPGSVLYVSFGSIAQSTKQEIEELARGLVMSGVYFIWVLRPDIVEDNDTDILPIGFEKDARDFGLMVPWCNQSMVLSSPATGGFLTHCGWNSILESMWFGVPMICYPFLVDQPTNRKLVVSDWNIGIDLCDGDKVTREEVAKKVELLMKGEKSEEYKEEIKKVSERLHDALSQKGSSQRNFDQFVNDLKSQLY